jgi:hypothetical protein
MSRIESTVTSSPAASWRSVFLLTNIHCDREKNPSILYSQVVADKGNVQGGSHAEVASKEARKDHVKPCHVGLGGR